MLYPSWVDDNYDYAAAAAAAADDEADSDADNDKDEGHRSDASEGLDAINSFLDGFQNQPQQYSAELQ